MYASHQGANYKLTNIFLSFEIYIMLTSHWKKIENFLCGTHEIFPFIHFEIAWTDRIFFFCDVTSTQKCRFWDLLCRKTRMIFNVISKKTFQIYPTHPCDFKTDKREYLMCGPYRNFSIFFFSGLHTSSMNDYSKNLKCLVFLP